MALFATIPRNLMLDRKVTSTARLMYGYWSMMLVGHKENRFDPLTVEKFIPLTRAQIIRFSEDLATRRYITFRVDDFYYYVSVPENVHARIDARTDQSSQTRKTRLRKDTRYVAEQIISLHGDAFYGERKPKVTDKILDKVNTRLNNFTSKEIIEACERRIEFIQQDAWWNQEENKKYRKNIFNLIDTDDKLDRWLNIDMSTVKKSEKLTGLNFD